LIIQPTTKSTTRILKDKQRIKNIEKCGRIPTHTKEFGRKECLGASGLFNILPSQGKMKTTQEYGGGGDGFGQQKK
jgi:hypothetical protein